jgi:hypothetical protein
MKGAREVDPILSITVTGNWKKKVSLYFPALLMFLLFVPNCSFFLYGMVFAMKNIPYRPMFSLIHIYTSIKLRGIHQQTQSASRSGIDLSTRVAQTSPVGPPSRIPRS